MNGKSFCKHAHLTRQPTLTLHEHGVGLPPYGIVKGFKDVNTDKFTYESSMTWTQPKEKVEAMVKAINDQNDQKVRFSIFGRHSIFNRDETKDNCFTWAEQQLKISGININNPSNVLISSTRRITQENLGLDLETFILEKINSFYFQFFYP